MLADIHNTKIRDNIDGNRLIDAPQAIRAVVDTKEFQRLRQIKQMGVSSFVFPTAEHSRFAHSLGVYATARKFFSQMKTRAVVLDLHTPVAFDEYSETDFSIATLCHDIGHTAFSHVLESVLLPKGVRSHEECAIEIIDAPDSQIGKVIRNVADVQSVKSLLTKTHANQALSDLVSSTFDVDRCDYILRDSQMAGVEYGSYDLNWLLHAVTVDVNSAGQPVLLMDGPRGIDALRQFLSARRYLHRQVYFHSTIRGAQILLKGIFARIQDLGKDKCTLRLAPPCLHAMGDGRGVSLPDFHRTTDVEILYMLRNFAEEHHDPVLKYLASCFVSRVFPKSIIDSAKSNVPISKRYRIADGGQLDEQLQLIKELIPADVGAVTAEIKDFVRQKFEDKGLPGDIANYIVSFDSAKFVSSPPSDLLFSFKGVIVPLQQIDPECVGFDVSKLLERFSITRLFVPRDLAAAAQEHLDAKYLMKAA